MKTQTLTQTIRKTPMLFPSSEQDTHIMPRLYIDLAYQCAIKFDPKSGSYIDDKKSTWNTTIIKENIGPIKHTYLHHDRGPGRMTTKIDLTLPKIKFPWEK